MMKKLLTIGLLFLSYITQANLINVNSNQDAAIDDNLCTIREALVAANFDVAYFGCPAGSGNDTITMTSLTNDAIQINSLLPIISGVEIRGPGVDSLVLFAAENNNGHIFQINTDSDVSFKDFRIGAAQSSAIDVVNVDELLIEDMRFLNNTAGGSGTYGGAIHADMELGDTQSINELIITDSDFTNNSAGNGGALAVSGNYPITINGSVFSNNSSTSPGGAIFRSNLSREVLGSLLSINNSQFMDNSSNSSGAAIFVDLAYMNIGQSLFHNHQGLNLLYLSRTISSIQNSLFAENSVNDVILHQSSAGTQTSSELTLSFNTFLDNQNRDVKNTNSQLLTTYLKANVFDGDDGLHCQGLNIFSLGNNVQRLGASCGSGINDYPGTDPLLLPLGLYGGDIIIAPPSPISLLVDAGVDCTNLDLSGEGRPRDGNGSGGLGQCDIGAVERPNAYGLSVSFPGNGGGEVNLPEFLLTCESSDACIWPLPRNESFSLNASADAGSTFIQWGGSCSGDTTCEVTINTFKFVSAEFQQVANPAQLTVVKNLASPTLEVTVTSSPAGINCGANCSAGFISGDLVNLIAEVESGTLIDSWQNCDIVLQNGRLCRVGLTGDTTVTINVVADSDVIFANGFE